MTDGADDVRTERAKECFLQGTRWFEAGDLDAAERAFLEALSLVPGRPSVLRNLSITYTWKADSLLDAGRYLEALAVYEKALNADPQNPIAWCNRGTVLNDHLDQPEQAIESYRRAIALEEAYQDANYNLGLALLHVGRFEEAVQSFDRLLALMPENADAWFSRGNALAALLLFDEALSSYERAIQLQPNMAGAWANRANTLNELRRFEEALACHDRALALRADSAACWANRSVTLTNLGRLDDALASSDEALRMDSEYAEAWCNRGNVLNQLHRHAEALACYDRSLALAPELVDTWANRGNVLNDLDRYQDAIADCDRGIALRPDHAECWSNRGNALANLRRDSEALESYDRAISLAPDFAEARWNKAVALLNMGRFAEGWPLYRWRWRMRSFESLRLGTTKPEWNGESSSRTLFVWAEQGVGDHVLFGSMLGNLEAYANPVVVSVDKRLIPIFSRSFPRFRFIDAAQSLSEDSYDEQIAIGDLGRFFRNATEDFEATSGRFLKDNPVRTDAWRTRLAATARLTVGVSWRSANQKFGASKSLPLHGLAPLFAMDEVQFINLQYDFHAADLEYLPEDQCSKLLTFSDLDTYGALDDVISVIQACDVIVTVSNTTAHLAGALGKQTLLLLPAARGKLWYWRSLAGRSVWYTSVATFSQGSQASWSEPVNRIARRLAELREQRCG
jgi:tetratricopeptide (TPR) repeat protein